MPREASAAELLRLADLEARIAVAPSSVQERFERARLLESLGRTAEAKQGYSDLLTFDPAHFGSLNNLATILYLGGSPQDARTMFERAVAFHPAKAVAHVNLGRVLFGLGETEPARAAYETALRLAPRHPEAHRGYGDVLAKLGEFDAAQYHRQVGFEMAAAPIAVSAYCGTGTPLRVLELKSLRAEGDTNTAGLFDDTLCQTTTIYVEYWNLALPLPEHDVVFNAISDPDVCEAALERASELLDGSSAPVINPPAAIRGTGRIVSAQRLREIADLVVPQIALIPRDEIPSREFAFPMLLRSPGFHNGAYFELVPSPQELAATLARLPGSALLAIEFIDTRRPDGSIAKYRVMAIGGTLYPLHLALSSKWKVHYFSAQMGENESHRAQEAAFLADMQGVLGRRAMRVLEAIVATHGLDYAGIDFAIDGNGNVVLFEANATMAIIPPSGDEHWEYRRESYARAFAAVRELLLRRSGRR